MMATGRAEVVTRAAVTDRATAAEPRYVVTRVRPDANILAADPGARIRAMAQAAVSGIFDGELYVGGCHGWLER